MKFKASVLAVAYLTTARGNDPCNFICDGGGSGGGNGGGNMIFVKPVATIHKQQPVCNCATGRGYSPGGARGGSYAPPQSSGYGGYGAAGGYNGYTGYGPGYSTPSIPYVQIIPVPTFPPVPPPPPQAYAAPSGEPPKEKIITTTVTPLKSTTPVCSVTTIQECEEVPVEPETITMHVPEKPPKNDTPPPQSPPQMQPMMQSMVQPIVPISIPLQAAPAPPPPQAQAPAPAPPQAPAPPPPQAQAPPPPQAQASVPMYSQAYYYQQAPPPKPAPRAQYTSGGSIPKDVCICDTTGGSGGNYQEGGMNCADQTNVDLAACREGNSYPSANITNVEVPLAAASQKASPPLEYSSGCPC